MVSWLGDHERLNGTGREPVRIDQRPYAFVVPQGLDGDRRSGGDFAERMLMAPVTAR